jgi:hypothetical protein
MTATARNRQPNLTGLVVPPAPNERRRQRILREASVVRGAPETKIRDTRAAARARLAAFDRGTGSLTQLAAGRLFVAYGEGALEVLRLAHEAGLVPGVNYAEAVFWLESAGVTGQTDVEGAP